MTHNFYYKEVKVELSHTPDSVEYRYPRSSKNLPCASGAPLKILDESLVAFNSGDETGVLRRFGTRFVRFGLNLGEPLHDTSFLIEFN